MDFKDIDVYQKEFPTSSGVAYATGDVIGTLLPVIDADPYQPQRFSITNVQVLDRDAQSANVDVAFFGQSMSAGTFADNSACAVTDAEFSKALGVAHVVDHTDLGGAGLSQSGPVNIAVNLQSGSPLYALVVARAARTHSSVSGLLLKLGVQQSGNRA